MEEKASRLKDLKMNKRTVIYCSLLTVCNIISVLATPITDPTECIVNNDSNRRIWPDLSFIRNYINPFDWIGKPVLPKPKRYDWALEVDSKLF